MQITQELLIRVVAEAIARKEGYYKQGRLPTIPQKTNNPGCLTHWRYVKRMGNENQFVPYPETKGFVQFPECERAGCMHDDHPCEIGWKALREQCHINIIKRGVTFLEFFQGQRRGKRTLYMGFSPSSNGTDPYEYAKEVIAFTKRKLGLSFEVDLNCIISDLIDTLPPNQPTVTLRESRPHAQHVYVRDEQQSQQPHIHQPRPRALTQQQAQPCRQYDERRAA